jgi:hypothetical protein
LRALIKRQESEIESLTLSLRVAKDDCFKVGGALRCREEEGQYDLSEIDAHKDRIRRLEQELELLR